MNVRTPVLTEIFRSEVIVINVSYHDSNTFYVLWAMADLNCRPLACQASTLTN